MAEDPRVARDPVVRTQIDVSTFSKAHQYGVLSVSLVYVAGGIEVVWVLTGHPGVFTVWEATIILGTITISVLGSVWSTTIGRLAPPPIAVQLSSMGLSFVYNSGRKVELVWKDRRFKSAIRDVYGPWDKDCPSELSHRYWLEPPRGALVGVEEPFFKAILEQASKNELSVTKEDLGGAAYNRRHRLVRVRYVIRTRGFRRMRK
ncbi:MAG: hypothetical protein JRN35_08420 [Nitrososphaerota archaeon]|nr:hypothetical protein [Nitrososphaerota archaeon]